LCCGCSKIGFSAQVSAENMIDLSEYRKCAFITKVTASTFNSQRLQISAVLLGLDLEFFSLGYNFSTFETEFHAVLRGEVVSFATLHLSCTAPISVQRNVRVQSVSCQEGPTCSGT